MWIIFTILNFLFQNMSVYDSIDFDSLMECNSIAASTEEILWSDDDTIVADQEVLWQDGM